MSSESKVVLLGSSANERGDLFCRAMSSLFTVLGYQDFHYDVSKSGREIDIQALHTCEQRALRAECKATSEASGGDELNKFAGAVQVEKQKLDVEIQPYFISLSGFKGTAIEQEVDAGGKRMVLLDAAGIVNEMVRGGVLVDRTRAAVVAAGFIGNRSDLVIEPEPSIVITKIGFLWLFIYAKDHERQFYSLVHADGTYIAVTLSKELEKDLVFKVKVKGLRYLEVVRNEDNKQASAVVKKKYISYLAKVCGEMQLDGLPADQEIGAKKLRLESLFVPLHLERIDREEKNLDSDLDLESYQKMAGAAESPEQPSIKALGEVLRTERRLAILGLPGSGKSTLIKRLAIAYSFPARKAMIADGLPDIKWLPLLVRCRQLEGQVRSPILIILREIGRRAELDEKEWPVFDQTVGEAIKSGKALVLIDGLDEISDESDRIAFVSQLRLFLSQYPAVSVVVTSRSAGFRVIGNALTGDCAHFGMAPFSKTDIEKLTIAWHAEVVGNRKDVLEGAKALASTIWDNFRLRSLAQNPLLLTTLLLVKRWVTQLPTRRSALYSRAVEVLLMTWNVEGHHPLDPDEVIPQLAFVALQMMSEGIQRIAHDDLQKGLYAARRSMPEVLGYAKLSVRDLIADVELRSSLLLQSGHEMKDGKIQPIYEFRHLLFQEYLAARAVIDSYLPDGKREEILDILEPHLADPLWNEVTILSASLGGRRSLDLMRKLTELSKSEKNKKRGVRFESSSLRTLLGECLADEVPLGPEDLHKAFKEIIPTYAVEGVFRSRYAADFFEFCRQEYWKDDGSQLLVIGSPVGTYLAIQARALNMGTLDAMRYFIEQIDGTAQQNVEACLMCAIYAFNQGKSLGPVHLSISEEMSNAATKLVNALLKHLNSDSVHAQGAACWALAWLGERYWIDQVKAHVAIPRLFELWAGSIISDVVYLAGWAIASIPSTEPEYRSKAELLNNLAARNKAFEVIEPNYVVKDLREKHAGALYVIYVGLADGQPNPSVTAAIEHRGIVRDDTAELIKANFPKSGASPTNTKS